MSRVGVVVPAYRSADYLPETLASVQAQHFEGWTCIVVDDGSPDDTAGAFARAVGDDPRFVLLRQANAGVAAARNAGLAALPQDVDLVAFLDADDLWRPEALSVLVLALDARPDAVGVYGWADYVDNDGAPFLVGVHPLAQQRRQRLRGRRLTLVPEDADADWDVLHVSCPIWPAAIALHRRGALEQVGGWDPALPFMEDWDLYLRTTRLGPFAVVQQVVADYRRHRSNATDRQDVVGYHHELLRARTWRNPDNTPGQRREVARAWRYQQVALTRRDLRLAAARLRSGERRAGLRWLAAAAVQSVQALRAGPPEPSRRRSRLLHLSMTEAMQGWDVQFAQDAHRKDGSP